MKIKYSSLLILMLKNLVRSVFLPAEWDFGEKVIVACVLKEVRRYSGKYNTILYLYLY